MQKKEYTKGEMIQAYTGLIRVHNNSIDRLALEATFATPKQKNTLLDIIMGHVQEIEYFIKKIEEANKSDTNEEAKK